MNKRFQRMTVADVDAWPLPLELIHYMVEFLPNEASFLIYSASYSQPKSEAKDTACLEALTEFRGEASEETTWPHLVLTKPSDLANLYVQTAIPFYPHVDLRFDHVFDVDLLFSKMSPTSNVFIELLPKADAEFPTPVTEYYDKLGKLPVVGVSKLEGQKDIAAVDHFALVLPRWTNKLKSLSITFSKTIPDVFFEFLKTCHLDSLDLSLEGEDTEQGDALMPCLTHWLTNNPAKSFRFYHWDKLDCDPKIYLDFCTAVAESSSLETLFLTPFPDFLLQEGFHIPDNVTHLGAGVYGEEDEGLDHIKMIQLCLLLAASDVESLTIMEPVTTLQVRMLMSNMPNTSLKELIMNGAKVGDRGVYAIAHAFAASGLESLHLAKNDITDRGADDISMAMAMAERDLKTINLDGNKIGPMGFCGLITTLRQRNHVTEELSVRGNTMLNKKFAGTLMQKFGPEDGSTRVLV
ncbi:unnamed protein product [Aphanomyces euteiches]